MEIIVKIHLIIKKQYIFGGGFPLYVLDPIIKNFTPNRRNIHRSNSI